MKINMVYASQAGARMDSSVLAGGGADDTAILQKILDTAPAHGGLHLVIDGACRISAPLRIHSNTSIVFPNSACGLFLTAGSNCCMLRNANWSAKGSIQDENISICGGTFNHHAAGQVHHIDEAQSAREGRVTNWVIPLEFHGVRNLRISGATIRNQRTFGALFANWVQVHVEQVQIIRDQRDDHENQDGLHFFGPGRFLTVRDISGNSGDDFLALAPDELDLESSIEDVLIDGVMLDGADQGIRLLCRAQGRLDRVIIRNVMGTYRSYGFYINPWFESTGGSYGNIVLENIDLRPLKNNYDYRPPVLFSLGGRIESISFRNIYHHGAGDGRRLFQVGGSYNLDRAESAKEPTHIDRLVIDGLYIYEAAERSMQDVYIHVRSHVEQMLLNNISLYRKQGLPVHGTLVGGDQNAKIDLLSIQGLQADTLKEICSLSDEQVGLLRKV